MKEWNDELTGRKVKQITELKQGAKHPYFRLQKRMPGGLMIAFAKHKNGNIIAFHPASGDVEELPITVGGYLRLREEDGRLWYTDQKQQIWHVDLPAGEPVLDAQLPETLPGTPCDITCDGTTVIFNEIISKYDGKHIAGTTDIENFWKYFHEQKRDGKLYAYGISSGECKLIVETKGEAMGHIDTSPVDPNLLKYSSDHIEFETQRIWSVNTDGTDLHKIRTTELGEMITHEFWSHGAQLIGYTYQDRRKDPTCYTLPWAEYSPMETQIGFSNLKGEEVYLSDPVNHHHSHVITSPDNNWISGEGTDGHAFVYLAALSLDCTRIRYFPMAAIHTPYTAVSGHDVNAYFSADSKWLVYNDTIDGVMQICAVEVDL